MVLYVRIRIVARAALESLAEVTKTSDSENGWSFNIMVLFGRCEF